MGLGLKPEPLAPNERSALGQRPEEALSEQTGPLGSLKKQIGGANKQAKDCD